MESFIEKRTIIVILYGVVLFECYFEYNNEIFRFQFSILCIILIH